MGVVVFKCLDMLMYFIVSCIISSGVWIWIMTGCKLNFS